ncbi:MAG: tRNA pseudouridine(55) synthase TruB [Methylococcaceae bacterium]
MSERTALRPISGVVLLDKATGLSSNSALQRVKRLFKARKAGHTGSLDPLASGLLPVCLGEATKLSGFLLNHDKRYTVTIRLGITTDTGDTEGSMVATAPVPRLTKNDMLEVLSGFRGEVMQKPPMYSAIKHQGKRLYELARQGIEVERKARPVTLYELNLLSMEDDSLELDVRCSKGTYIRTLAEDIGNVLGCGGHVTRLRRTEVGDLTLAQAYTESSLASLPESPLMDTLLPPDAIISNIPAVHLSDEQGFYVQRGQAVRVTDPPATDGWVRLYLQHTRFLGMGIVLNDGRIAPRRLLNSEEQDAQT